MQTKEKTINAVFTGEQIKRYVKYKKALPNLLQAGFEAARMLREICDEELYKRDGFTNFKEFCVSIKGMTGSRAFQLIAALDVKESLPEEVNHWLTNERQARALLDVPPKERGDVIERAAESGDVTARSIAEAADQWQPGMVQAVMLEKIASIWERFKNLEGKWEKVLVDSVNLMREIGLHLQGLSGHERMSRGKYLKLKELLPADMDFDKTKNCIRLTHKFKNKATLQECGEEAETVCLVRGSVKTKHRTEKQQSHAQTPFVTVTNECGNFRVMLDKVLGDVGKMDAHMRASIKNQLESHIKWLTEAKGKL